MSEEIEQQPTASPKQIQQSYDVVAADYAEHIYDELSGKPLDRLLLDQFARRVTGLVCDMGCGPGQIGRYLRDLGVNVIGSDFSHGMLNQARRLNTDIAFVQSDMRALGLADGSLGGIAAFYAIVNIPRHDIAQLLREFQRVLRPDGVLLLSFHIGNHVNHMDDWWDHAVTMDFIFFQPEEIADALRAAGFVIDDVVMRWPYPEVEHPSQRAYLIACRPVER